MIQHLKWAVPVFFAGVMTASYSQSVSLNSPAPWTTLRSDTVQVKAQVDTSLLKQKQIDYSLISVTNGVKKTVITKQVKVKDISSDAVLNKMNKELLGGTDYLRIDWKVTGTAGVEKGSVSPIGIVDLTKLAKEPVQVKQIADNIVLKDVAGTIKDDQFTKCGTAEYATVWNKKALFIVIKKSSDSSALVFGLDGKNGKNAFAAYADRFIGCKNDSVWSYHYKRDLVNDTLKYTETPWNTDITKEASGDKIAIQMSWYDPGIVPFEGRKIGFAAFQKFKGKANATIPGKASELIPGTWGDIVLVK